MKKKLSSGEEERGESGRGSSSRRVREGLRGVRWRVV